MNLEQYDVNCSNDNTFVFNRILGYNAALFDDVDNKYQCDRVNDVSTTCYIGILIITMNICN